MLNTVLLYNPATVFLITQLSRKLSVHIKTSKIEADSSFIDKCQNLEQPMNPLVGGWI